MSNICFFLFVIFAFFFATQSVPVPATPHQNRAAKYGNGSRNFKNYNNRPKRPIPVTVVVPGGFERNIIPNTRRKPVSVNKGQAISIGALGSQRSLYGNGSSDTKFWGLTYSPYNTDGSCSDYKKVLSDLKVILTVTNRIRLYSTDCNQLENVVKAITQNNLPMEVYAGIWISDGAQRASNEIDTLIQVAKTYGSSVIKGISVGNEELFKGSMSESELIASINNARAAFSAAGLAGIPVYTTDTDANFTQNVANACDLIQVNIHTIYDTQRASIDDLASSVVTRVRGVRSKIGGGKKVRIGETGYSSAGSTGARSGSLSSASGYASRTTCLLKSANIEYFYFEAKDAVWKAGASQVEQNFGVFDANFQPKFDVSRLGSC
ncbi:hypothetical protein BB560_004487 [Smittium megazygosporum]|uniref:glucan endo-1,3-beta-D-glucosidase n=1 Tax=Smittium megazygosporum TaxID=133381 RepID=A0A2T9Z9A4_9FUNG|nr:hypothetical protein BB560_004487 [Smittium megazygosporum]